MLHPLRLAVLGLAAWGLLAACGADTQTVVRFEARVGTEAFECGRTYSGLGTTGTDYTAQDFRFYAHEVRLIAMDGTEVPLVLSGDGAFSDGEVVLLDFETGGACDGGNAPTNFEIAGLAPSGEYRGLRFVLGVPAALNHLDSATAPSPLNLSSMYWGWMDGYKFIRVEGRTTGLPAGTVFHVGSTACAGSAMEGTRVCANPNRGTIEIIDPAGFDPSTDVIVADLASLYATSDLDVDGGGSAGCLSGPDDPECATLLPRVGVGGTQALFRIEHR